MPSPAKTRETIRIIACGVFKPALEYIHIKKSHPNIQITFLPSVLHLRPSELKNFLRREIESAKRRNEKVICLYGECFPGIDDFCEKHCVKKMPGSYCYEMFLGPERFRQLTDETTGTYFMEKDLIINFEQHCVVPLELHDKMMREYCFEHYEKLLYVRQPADPELVMQAETIAGFLELVLDIQDADYSFLKSKLDELIEQVSSGK